MQRSLDLRGRVVFISRGSRGLGLELARIFGTRGARVAIVARDAGELASAEAQLRADGIDAFSVVADMRRRDANEHALEAAQSRFGPIDVLVNNAGSFPAGPRTGGTGDDYRDALETHFWAALYAIEALTGGMRARGSGRIVNITSLGGRVSVPHLLPYSAGRFALVALSEGLRAELLRDGVYVTTVVPGLMRTGSPERTPFEGHNRLEDALFGIGAALPFLSTDITEAAQAIVDATERGDAELTLSAPAKLLSLLHGVAPGVLTEVLGFIARALPPAAATRRNGRPAQNGHAPFPPALTTAPVHAHFRPQEPDDEAEAATN